MGELSSEIRKEAKRKLGSRVPQRMFRKKKIKAKFRLNKSAFIFPQCLHAEAWHLKFHLPGFLLTEVCFEGTLTAFKRKTFIFALRLKDDILPKARDLLIVELEYGLTQRMDVDLVNSLARGDLFILKWILYRYSNLR